MCCGVFISYPELTDNFAISANAANESNYPYYYDKLTSKQQKLFVKMRTSVQNCNERFTVNYAINAEDLQKVSDLLYYYDPLMFNIANVGADLSTNKATIKIGYFCSKDDYEKKLTAIDKKANEIIKAIPTSSSVYTKIKFIHDSIAKSCSYDLYAADCENPYGVFVGKRAKCDGYSRAFSYVCSKIGIKTITVLGFDIQDNNSAHMWNKVYYNKQWYNVDVTYDDPVSILADNVRYNYFMISDAELSKTHKQMAVKFTVPAANDDTKSYFKSAGLQVDTLNEGKKVLINSIIKASKTKKYIVSIQFKTQEEYDKAVKSLITDRGIYSILRSANKTAVNPVCDNVYLSAQKSTNLTIDFIIFYPDTKLSKYYVDTSTVNDATKSVLEKHGIK